MTDLVLGLSKKPLNGELAGLEKIKGVGLGPAAHSSDWLTPKEKFGPTKLGPTSFLWD